MLFQWKRQSVCKQINEATRVAPMIMKAEVSRDGSGRKFALCKLICISDLTISSPPDFCFDEEAVMPSVADLWLERGVVYSESERASILQALVQFIDSGDGAICSYPVDRLTRLEASINANRREILEINTAIRDFSWPPFGPDSESIEVYPRDGFRAPEGFVLLAADYSQIELRLLAHFSEDVGLCENFTNEADVFRSMASKWLQKSEVEVTDIERVAAKQICYANIYGAGAQQVAKQANISETQAALWMRDFLRTFPGVVAFKKMVVKNCRKLGYVETLLGRRRLIEGISSPMRKDSSRAERKAVNSICQGSASDLIKVN